MKALLISSKPEVRGHLKHSVRNEQTSTESDVNLKISFTETRRYKALSARQITQLILAFTLSQRNLENVKCSQF